MADGGGSFDFLDGLTLAEREVLRRMRGYDKGEGCWVSAAKIARARNPGDFEWSVKQVREIIRRLREKGRILLAGVRRMYWTLVYVFPDRTYREEDLDLCPKATAALLALAPQYIEAATPERREAATAGWSVEPARLQIQPRSENGAQGEAPAAPVQILGVYINRHLLKAYSRAVLEQAVRSMVDYYGPKLDQKGGVKYPASFLKAKCARLVAQQRDVREPQTATADAPARPSAAAPTAPAPEPVDPLALARAEELERAQAEGRFEEVFKRQMDEEAARRRAAASRAAQPAPLVPAPAPVAEQAAPEAPTLTIGELVRRLVDRKQLDTSAATQGYYKDRLPIIERLVGELPAAEWSHDSVLAYAKQRSGVKMTTIKRELDMIKAALRQARRSDRRLAAELRDPFEYWPKLRAVVEARKEYVRRADLPKLLHELTQQYQRDWVLWAVYTGARRGELRRLRWEDLDTEAQRIHIRGTKTSKSDRWIPLHDELIRWCVERRSAFTQQGPILPRWTNMPRDLADACARAGIARVSANSLRRTFGSWLRQAGVPDAVIAELMGHTDTKMVARVYGQLTEEQGQAAIRKL